MQELSETTRTLFDQFVHETRDYAEGITYGFSKAKARSCQWMVKRINGGTGVDVGGTEYLCKALAAKGCDVTFFDIHRPVDFPKFVQDDMFNVASHFPERSLDFITTRHTLEHAIVPLFQLWQYNKLLKDDGRLYVILPMHSRRWVWFRSHHNCLPYENWEMLFYRAGFKTEAAEGGTWNPKKAHMIEWRFELSVERRGLRLANEWRKRGKAAEED